MADDPLFTKKNYYAPDIFKSIGLTAENTDILATGVYGMVMMAFLLQSQNRMITIL